jgi:transaldolase/glucose-6-phosphate isomerase
VRGKIAIANAKRAYQTYKTIYGSGEWAALAGRGAHRQRLLWASTGTKNPAYPDTYYVDTLIGGDTVNTMPPDTLKAFRDHGTPEPGVIEQDVAGAEASLAALQALGISLDHVTHDLVIDGVKKFVGAFDHLLGGVAKKRTEMTSGQHKAA